MLPEQCVERLRGAIHQQRIMMLSWRPAAERRGSSKPVHGEIDGLRFRIQRYRRVAAGDEEIGPICYGVFLPREHGTEIVVRFDVHPLVRWSYLALLSVVVVSGYGVMIGLLLGTRTWRAYWPDMIGHGLLVVLVLGSMYFSIPRREQTYIVDFLKWKFDARVTSRRW